MTSQSPSFPFHVLLVFSRISLFSFKSTHLFYYATHTQQKLVSRWSVGKQMEAVWCSLCVSQNRGSAFSGLILATAPGTAPKPHLTPLVRSLPLSYKTRLAQERTG